MPRLAWSSEAVRILATLPRPVQIDVLMKSRLLSEFSEMYPARRRGRYRGQRFFVSFEWLVYHITRRDLVAITTIGHARRRGA